MNLQEVNSANVPLYPVWLKEEARSLLSQGIASDRENNALQALKLYIAASQAEPRWFAPHYLLGNLMYRQGDHAMAAKSYAICIELEPRWSAAYLNIAQCFKYSEMWNEAVGASLSYTRLEPHDPDGFMVLATIYMRTGHTEKENAAYRSAIEASDCCSAAHLNYAVNLLQVGDKKNARTHFNKVLSVEPKNSEAYIKATKFVQLC